MLTKRGYYNILDNIFKTGGLSAAMEEDLKKLKSDYDEREGMLRKYGEVYDGEDKDEYEYREFENDSTDWKAKYDALNAEHSELKTRYRQAFIWGQNLDDNIEVQDSEVDTPTGNKEETVDIDRLLY